MIDETILRKGTVEEIENAFYAYMVEKADKKEDLTDALVRIFKVKPEAFRVIKGRLDEIASIRKISDCGPIWSKFPRGKGSENNFTFFFNALRVNNPKVAAIFTDAIIGCGNHCHKNECSVNQ